MHFIRDNHRKILSVTGAEAESWLQGLVSQSVQDMRPADESQLASARYGALLTPQGKIISDIFFFRVGDGFLLDCPESGFDTLLKRLMLYRLRAKVDFEVIETLGAGYCLREVLNGEGLEVADTLIAPDPRMPDWAMRSIAPMDFFTDNISKHADYHARRIALSIPEFGLDYESESVFPTDVNMDILNGVDYTKGCFIGQEVVSRMKRRSKIRKRTIAVRFLEPNDPKSHDDWLGKDILAGDKIVGELGERFGDMATARIRMDRLGQALRDSQTLSCNGVVLELILTHWVSKEMQAIGEADAV